MASFFNKALEYLGLKEFDEDEFYDDEEVEEEIAPRRVRRPSASEREREPRLAAEPVTASAPALRITGNPLRPVPLDDVSSNPTQATSVIRPISSAAGSYAAQPVVHIVTPHQFDSAQEIASAVKGNKCVIVNLLGADKDLTRRLVDFCAGLTMGVDGRLERVTEQVFLLSPSNVTISNDERTRLQDRGFNGL